MYGQYVRRMDGQLISTDDTFLWWSKGDLMGEVEAAQDQALHAKYHAIKILQTETDSKCKLCRKFDETVECIISASQIQVEPPPNISGLSPEKKIGKLKK